MGGESGMLWGSLSCGYWQSAQPPRLRDSGSQPPRRLPASAFGCRTPERGLRGLVAFQSCGSGLTGIQEHAQRLSSVDSSAAGCRFNGSAIHHNARLQTACGSGKTRLPLKQRAGLIRDCGLYRSAMINGRLILKDGQTGELDPLDAFRQSRSCFQHFAWRIRRDSHQTRCGSADGGENHLGHRGPQTPDPGFRAKTIRRLVPAVMKRISGK